MKFDSKQIYRLILSATLVALTSFANLSEALTAEQARESHENLAQGLDWEDAQYVSKVERVSVARVEGNLEQFVVHTKRGSRFEFDFLAESEPYSHGYNHLTPSQRIRFLEKRQWALVKLSNFLDSNQLTLGVATSIGNKWDKTKERVVRICKSGYCATKKLLGKNVSPIEEIAAESLEQKEFNERNVRERGRVLVGEILASVHRMMWEQSELVTEQNEFGLTLGIAPIFISGAGDFGRGGAMGLSVSVGFNTSNDSLILELATDVDRFQKAITPTFTVGLAPKAGFYMRHLSAGNELNLQEGTTFFPPAVPGYITNVNEMFVAGVNSSIVSFPPLVGDLYSYMTSTKRKPFFRITASHMTKGFLRVHFGLPFDAKPIMTKISDFFNSILNRVKNSFTGCGSIFRSKSS